MRTAEEYAEMAGQELNRAQSHEYGDTALSGVIVARADVLAQLATVAMGIEASERAFALTQSVNLLAAAPDIIISADDPAGGQGPTTVVP